jgi:hypothetical protein
VGRALGNLGSRRDSALPERLTQIDRARAADQPDTGADQSTDNDTWRAANQTNSRANARAGQAAVARRCTATAE